MAVARARAMSGVLASAVRPAQEAIPVIVVAEAIPAGHTSHAIQTAAVRSHTTSTVSAAARADAHKSSGAQQIPATTKRRTALRRDVWGAAAPVDHTARTQARPAVETSPAHAPEATAAIVFATVPVRMPQISNLAADQESARMMGAKAVRIALVESITARITAFRRMLYHFHARAGNAPTIHVFVTLLARVASNRVYIRRQHVRKIAITPHACALILAIVVKNLVNSKGG